MSKFIFLFLIPVIAGVYTSSIGLSLLNPDTALNTLGILSLVCLISVFIFHLFFNEREGK
tara:strand:- start:470 stop:649 length:180 start_codon:yes stop_codon:yes gene_type:complete